MIALDTDVLVPFIVDDPGVPEQNGAARNLVLSSAQTGETMFLPDVVLCEFVWVLRRAYGVGRGEVAATLQALLETEKHRVRIDGRRHRSGRGLRGRVRRLR